MDPEKNIFNEITCEHDYCRMYVTTKHEWALPVPKHTPLLALSHSGHWVVWGWALFEEPGYSRRWFRTRQTFGLPWFLPWCLSRPGVPNFRIQTELVGQWWYPTVSTDIILHLSFSISLTIEQSCLSNKTWAWKHFNLLEEYQNGCEISF